MATKKKSITPIKKKSATKKQTAFVGTWKTFESRFMGNKVEQSNSSSWTILPGNKIEEYGKIYQCKVKKGIIEIPTSSNNVWIGEMQPKGVLKISTSNGMGSFYCRKIK